MKKKNILILILLIMVALGCYAGDWGSASEDVDRVLVEKQQQHYQNVHPLPFFEFSIPRSVYIQIYEVVTTQAFSTYTLIQSITGDTVFMGPSIGYAIPVDTSLTNPLQSGRYGYHVTSYVLGQAEPNGLFSSKNTDGTWVLFIQPNGDITPVYTEQKVTTFPYPVIQDENGLWVRADSGAVDFTIDPNKREEAPASSE